MAFVAEFNPNSFRSRPHGKTVAASAHYRSFFKILWMNVCFHNKYFSRIDHKLQFFACFDKIYSYIVKERKTQNPELLEKTLTHEEIFSLIKPYAQMGMTVREIEFAISILGKLDVPRDLIAASLAVARRRGDIPRAEKQRIISTISGESITADDTLQESVNEWLIAKEILVRGKVELPQGRDEWGKAVREMKKNYEPESLRNVKRLLNRGAPVGDAVQIAKIDGQETKDPIIGFAQMLVANGFIGEDQADVFKLNRICREKETELPSFAHGVILESFIKARKALKYGDSKWIREYCAIRENSFLEEASDDSEKLAKLEDALSEADTWGVESLNIDHIGFYRISEGGGKYRMPVGISEHGTIIFDNPDLRERREELRERNAAARFSGRQSLVSLAANRWDLDHPLDGDGS